GGLPRIEVLTVVSPGESVSIPQPITLDLTWPEVAAAVAKVTTLRGSSSLSWWVPGTDYRRRVGVGEGEVTSSAYDYASAPAKITITPSVGVETALVPDSSFAVTAEAWPINSTNPGGASVQALGLTYPIVFGSPGQVTVTESASAIFGELSGYPGSPALAVETSLTIAMSGDRIYSASTLLLCLGRVEADAVMVMYPSTSGSGSGWLSERFLVQTQTDGLGRTVSVVDVLSSTAGADLEQADKLYISWCDAYATPTSAMIGDDGRPVAGAGAVIEWMLRRSSIPYDPTAWMGVRGYLDAWQVDTYIDDPVGPWTWVAEVLLPHLPVSVIPLGGALTPVIWMPDARPDQARDHLRVGHDCSRSSAVAVRSMGESTVAATLALDADSGQARATVTMQPEPDVGAAIGSSAWARAARDVTLADGSETIDVGWTARRATAAAASAWRIAQALGWREVEVDVGQERGWLAHGDVVLITDPDVGLSSTVAQVAGITYRDSGMLSLLLVVWGVGLLSSSVVPLDDTPEQTQ
ncbi:MAG: hypothetical protein ACO3UX_11315, partial [Candidatus Nanopelagicales bacterium]